jgi:hypothetical protein
MSEVQNEFPNPVDAYNHLFSNIHARVFLNKLASEYGIHANSEKEATDLFAIAGRLREHENPVKQAADQSRFGDAAAALNSVIESTPAGQQQLAYTQDFAIKQAAAELMQDPAVYNSVLALKAEEAAQLAGAE